MARTLLAIVGAVLSMSIGAATPFAQAVRANAYVDRGQLLSDLKVLSADDMLGRRVDTPGGARARAFVIRRFTESGIRPLPGRRSFLEPFSFRAGRGVTRPLRHGVNVVGTIDGRRRPRRYIVVSAHYDHIGTVNGDVANGADDNASGTAALFALGRYFSAHQPENSLIFAAFDGEEAGLRGSREFVRAPPVEASALIVDVNMDMIGREYDNRLFAVGTAANPFLRPVLEGVARTAPVRLLFGHEDPTKEEDWSRDSDHHSFQEAGIPAVYLGVEDFAQHHKVTDDYATMTFDFYVRAVETCARVVEAFDRNLDSIARAPRR
jgi:hypothetical protein